MVFERVFAFILCAVLIVFVDYHKALVVKEAYHGVVAVDLAEVAVRRVADRVEWDRGAEMEYRGGHFVKQFASDGH